MDSIQMAAKDCAEAADRINGSEGGYIVDKSAAGDIAKICAALAALAPKLAPESMSEIESAALALARAAFLQNSGNNH